MPGDKFKITDSEPCYTNITRGQGTLRWRIELVENNPEWFKEEKEEYEVTHLAKVNRYDVFGNWYQFRLETGIIDEKLEKIKSAIEKVLNNLT